ncbi:MAG: DUF4384 domain-containing protein [Alistipes sp.]|nr:DUF4384 domain-containing protein [Alistipes sp.]
MSNGKFYIFVLLITLLLPLSAAAQNTHKVRVTGKFTYHGETTDSFVECKAKALEGARRAAIAREFGTFISQTTSQTLSYDDGEEHQYFSQISENELRGEWIEDLSEPKYEVDHSADGEWHITCTITGYARKYNNTAEFDVMTLRNHPDLKDAETHFISDMDLYLYFEAPADGYVAVYLVDETPEAYCLLPYQADSDGQYRVKGGKEYIFFSEEHATSPEERAMVDTYFLSTTKMIERNKLYVIFSKNPFTKAVDHYGGEKIPRKLSFESFSHWMGHQRAHDSEMGVRVLNLEIKSN